MKVADDTSRGTLECEWVKFIITMYSNPGCAMPYGHRRLILDVENLQ